MDKKKGQPSVSKKKECQNTFKEGKNKEKGKDKKITSIIHQCEDPKNHCNHCNIYGHTNYFKLHPKFNQINHRKDGKKKNMLGVDSTSNKVEISSNADEEIVCTTLQKEVSLNSLPLKEEKDMTKLSQIKISVKKTKLYALFYYSS